jgi:competence protein ComEC
MLQVDKIARERGIPVLLMGRGGAIQLDPRVRIDVLNPPVSLYTGTHSDLNNNSLVLKVSYGDVSLLLTGDIEQDAMQGLVRYLGSSRAGELRATVLKLPHHGSKYSLYDDFARLVQPQYVVISVGPNSFGHPAPETLAFWSERGAQILRTDQDGALVFETDGQQLVLKTGKTQGSRILKDRGLSTATGYLTGDNVSLRN